MSLTIRPLRTDDEAEWRRLWTGYLEFYQTSVPEEVYATTFSRLLDPAKPHQNAFVAEAEGKLVGLVHFITHATNWKLEEIVYLQDLYVDPATRGTGAGRALIEAVYEWADGNGTPTVYWLTQTFNTTARQLYDRIAKETPFIRYMR